MRADDRRVPLLRRLAQDLRPVRGRLAVAAIAIVGLGAAQLYLTWLVKRLLDGPLATGDPAALTPILAEGLATLAISAVALAAARYLVASANLRLVHHLRRQAATRLLQMPLSVARRYATGDVLARVLTDATVLTTFLGTVVRRAVRELVVAGGAMALLFVLNWRLALAGLLVVPPCVWLIDRFGRRLRRAGARTQDDLGRLGALLSEQLAGLSTIKGFGAEQHESDRFTTASGHVQAQALAGERIGAALTGIVFLLTGVALVAIVGWGTLLLASGQIDRTGFFLFGLYAAQAIEPLRRLSELQGQLQPALASAARLYEIIDQREIESRDGLSLPDRPARQLAFDRVTFRFADGADVLHGLTLHLRAGDQVALVGPSGAGKSTMAALVRRFLSPSGGEIRVDDLPIDQLAVGDLRRAAIVVEQDTFLFSGSIEDNIRLGRTDVTPLAVKEAVRLAGLTAVCAALPQGLATPAHEAGRRLSGGEKQRVALARAILHDPGLLILDEATSALDGDTEAAVFAALDQWLRRRTVIAISHRWATVARFPRLVALANGRIVADGPTDAVAHATPLVRELFADQWSAPTV